MVEINCGLHYISICCDAVDKLKNFDNEGKRSCMIATLLLTTDQTLKGSVTHFSNVDSRASINKGQYNSVNIIGSILLELYITQKINEKQRICY